MVSVRFPWIMGGFFLGGGGMFPKLGMIGMFQALPLLSTLSCSLVTAIPTADVSCLVSVRDSKFGSAGARSLTLTRTLSVPCTKREA